MSALFFDTVNQNTVSSRGLSSMLGLLRSRASSEHGSEHEILKLLDVLLEALAECAEMSLFEKVYFHAPRILQTF